MYNPPPVYSESLPAQSHRPTGPVCTRHDNHSLGIPYSEVHTPILSYSTRCTHTHICMTDQLYRQGKGRQLHLKMALFFWRKWVASGGTRTHKGSNILQTMQLLCQCQTPAVVMHVYIFNHVINLQKSFPHKSVSRSPGYGPDPVPRRPWSGFGSYIVVTLACLVSSVISTNMPPLSPPPPGSWSSGLW